MTTIRVRFSRAVSPSSVGRRVMVRHTGDDGRPTDAVGDLRAWDGGRLTVATRSGDVVIAESDVIAGKEIPEPHLRTALDAPVSVVERCAALAAGATWQGGWLLGPATVVPVGAPGEPLDAALARVVATYAERGTPAVVRLPLPDAAALDDALAARGWPLAGTLEVMVADVAAVRAGTPTAEPVAVEGAAVGPVAVVGGWAVAPGARALATAVAGALAAGARHLVADAPVDAPEAAAALAAAGFAAHHRCRLRSAP